MKKLLPILLLPFLLIFTQCLPFNALLLGAPDRKDLQRFDSRTIQAADNCFQFYTPTKMDANRFKINDWTKDIPFFKPLPELVQSHEVRSMLVIHKDSLIFEYYGKETNQHSLHPSYSIAKSFTSALIGIAIDEGTINSEQDLVIQYLPELQGDPHFQKLTIEQLLNHTSGIKYTLEIDAKIYYDSNSLKALKKIEFETPPGTKQHYLNINVQLLGLILHRATRKFPAKYLEEKIWQPIGMCTNAVWSIDKKNKLEKTFCCLGATAQDYAKFGRLFLHKGNWNGEQVISEAWHQKSTRRDTTQGSSFNYNYCWHIGLKEYGDYMANGLYKQHIYIYPKKELIIVLLNNKEHKLEAERVNWWNVFRQIADQV